VISISACGTYPENFMVASL